MFCLVYWVNLGNVILLKYELSLLSTIISGTEIKYIEPTFGSLAGGTIVSVIGVGFSNNTYLEGNEVRLVSTTRSYDCAVRIEPTIATVITCVTP